MGACGRIPVYVRRVCVYLMRLGEWLFVELLCLLRGRIALEFALVLLGFAGCRMHCIFVPGDAWPMLLSPCSTTNVCTIIQRTTHISQHSMPMNTQVTTHRHSTPQATHAHPRPRQSAHNSTATILHTRKRAGQTLNLHIIACMQHRRHAEHSRGGSNRGSVRNEYISPANAEILERRTYSSLLPHSGRNQEWNRGHT